MNGKSNFYFYKWYADLIDEETNDVTIIYMGEVEWNILKLTFTNILEFLERKKLISKATFSNYHRPIYEKDIFQINSMEIEAKWETKQKPIIEKLYENAHGYILWECFLPHALGDIKSNEKLHQGFGYIEKLTMTIKPWQIPIDILRWGRFLSENHCIIWIQWQGKEEKFLIYHNEVKYINGIINDDLIQFGNYRLLLLEKNILRNGPLIKTVFDKFLWIKKIFPSGILHMNECKWQTWSEFYENNNLITKNWSIHEHVNCKPRINIFGKIFYGFLFTILLPIILIFWSKQTEKYITLPIPNNIFLACSFILIGSILMILAMMKLWFEGNGLPMNAYPPSNLVTTGIYQLFSHPIYIGSSLLSFGLAIYYQSSSGFWLISIILTLSWLALVYGYENDDLKKRFPNLKWNLLMNIPEDIDNQCEWKDIISIYCLVLIPWLILYQTIIFIGIPHYSISTYLYFESKIPVIEWTELFYISAYPYVIILPLILQTKKQIRSFILTSLMNVSIGIYLQFIFPLIATPKSFVPKTFLGQLLLYERYHDGPSCALPSFHVSWAFICGNYYGKRFPKLKILFYIFSFCISISCITTGMHSILDVLTGFLLFILCIQRINLWLNLKHLSEYLGNSWSCYRIGKLRIINHGLYTLLSVSIGFIIVCSLIGNIYAMLIVNFLSVIGACIWAQFIEQSSGLSRPFGYFGCITGGIIGSLIASYIFSIPILSIIASHGLAAPWIQALGRLRCLVQGCCHGRTTSEFFGILITNSRSRVCSLSKLKNSYIHNTAGYSIFANILIGMLLWRLWYSNVCLILIVSLYFILIGLSRFVEETYRGEIQTPIYYKLTIYQWMSILFVFIGIFISIIPFDDYQRLKFNFHYEYLPVSIGFGLIVAFATSVDFPESHMRFSRLSD